LWNGQVGFSIGNKGYVGTGQCTSTTYANDFWEYDPSLDAWTQKANFGGTARTAAVGFSIGTQGYIGTGAQGNSAKYKDFWEYNPTNNTWIQRLSFGGTARWIATGFSIGTKGYIGTGFDASGDRNDFWEYTPDSTAGVHEINLDNYFSVYPNPSKGIINVKNALSNLQVKSVEIYNVAGEKVFTSAQQSDISIIDLSAQPNGIYFLNLKSEKGIAAKEVIIDK
ncbi:MAG: T9SS type A sorting domain-containing protein, partial [Bacteroidia bacterium]